MKKLPYALALATVAAAGLASSAHAEEAAPPTGPVITRVAPDPVELGERLTVRGDCAPTADNPVAWVSVKLSNLDDPSGVQYDIYAYRLHRDGRFTSTEVLADWTVPGDYWVSAACVYRDGSLYIASYDGTLTIEQ